jgi:hypothetical protein
MGSMRTDACINLYLRDERVLVVPSVRHDIEPVLIVEPVESEVQRAVEEAIQVATTVPEPEDDYDPKKWPVLKALGLKTAKAFHQNVAHAIVLLYEGKIEVLPSAPAKRGPSFIGSGEHVPVPDVKSIAAIALRVLRESPRMNPRP